MPVIKLTGDAILAFSKYEDKDICKSIPTARWNKNARAWSYDLSYESILSVVSEFENAGLAIKLSDEAKKYYSDAHNASVDLEETLSGEPEPLEYTAMKPWRHQLVGVRFAQNRKNCILSFTMSAGKTKTAIDLMQNSAFDRALVLCPKHVIDDAWVPQIELHRDERIKFYVISDSSKKSLPKKIQQFKKQLSLNVDRVVLITNYEALDSKAFQEFVKSYHWDYLIGDESHRTKSPGSKRSRFLYSVRGNFKSRIGLTGTIFPNRISDVYGQARWIEPAYFGTSYNAFIKKFFNVDFWGNPIGLIEERAEAFYAILNRFVLQVGEDVLDLPEHQDIQLTCEFEPSAREAYCQMARSMAAEIEKAGGKRRYLVASNGGVKGMRLQQLTGGWLFGDLAEIDENIPVGAIPVSIGKKDKTTMGIRISEAKAKLFGDLMDDLDQEPIMVVCRFHNDIDAVHAECHKRGVLSSELSSRSNGLQEWKSGETQVLVVQCSSAGEGIDCTRARHQAFYSFGYSPGPHEQIRKRVLRTSQKRGVTFYYLSVKDTVDSAVYNAIVNKQDWIDSILEHVTKA